MALRVGFFQGVWFLFLEGDGGNRGTLVFGQSGGHPDFLNNQTVQDQGPRPQLQAAAAVSVGK